MRVSRFVFCVAGLAACAGSAMATQTTGHFIEGDMHGDWELTNQVFIPASQASYGFDTLLVEEHVPGYIWPDGQDDARVDDGGRPAERWADLWVTVTRPSTAGRNDSSSIAFDKPS